MAGGGPAGLAAAAALGTEGLRVLRVAPQTPWSATYCCWWDELLEAARRLGLGDAYSLATRYDSPLVRTRSAGEQLLPRAYARLDNGALSAGLRDRARAAGVVERRGRVVDVRRDAMTAYAVLADGTEVPAALVVDATGGPGAAPAQQRAWGEVVLGAGDLLPTGGALFMDWDTPGHLAGPPAFLYGLDLGDGTALLELTSLAARPPAGLEVLRQGLHLLLAEHGLGTQGRSERVAIPLGRHGRPARAGVLRVGAAAGRVHPATGYSVAASLLSARPLAQAVATQLAGRSALDAAAPLDLRAVSRALQPPAAALTGFLLDRGLDTLLPLPAADLDAFFAAFFALPERRWSSYLDVASEPAAVAVAMSGTLLRLPWKLRRAAVRGTVVGTLDATREGLRALTRPGHPGHRIPAARAYESPERGSDQRGTRSTG